MSTFTEYRDHLKQSDVPTLGVLCWYTVPEATIIKHDELAALLTTNGLEQFIPREPKDEDVFRRCCTSGSRKRQPTDDPDVFANYLVRDVNRVAGRVWKHIVVEQVDGANTKLDYSPTIELMFNGDGGPGTADITLDMLPAFDAHTAEGRTSEEIAKFIVDCFEGQRGHLNSYAIRDLIRKVFDGSKATTVRPAGGVYFVMRQHTGNVAGLEILAEQMHGVEVHSLPLIDDGKQRDMLKRSFEAETVGSIDSNLAKIDELLAGPAITERKLGDMTRDMAALRERTSEYAELLETELGNTEFRLTVYGEKMKQLVNHVKVN